MDSTAAIDKTDASGDSSRSSSSSALALRADTPVRRLWRRRVITPVELGGWVEKCPRCGLKLSKGKEFIKQMHAGGYGKFRQPWTLEEDKKLVTVWGKVPLQILAEVFQRPPTAVRARAVKFGLDPDLKVVEAKEEPPVTLPVTTESL